jgi:hypothetical protein
LRVYDSDRLGRIVMNRRQTHERDMRRDRAWRVVIDHGSRQHRRGERAGDVARFQDLQSEPAAMAPAARRRDDSLDRLGVKTEHSWLLVREKARHISVRFDDRPRVP